MLQSRGNSKQKVSSGVFSTVFDLDFPKQFVNGVRSTVPALLLQKSRSGIVMWADSHYMDAKLICSIAHTKPVAYDINLFTVIGQEHLSGADSQDVFIYASEFLGDTGRNEWKLIAACTRAFDGDAGEVVDLTFDQDLSRFNLLSRSNRTVYFTNSHAH